MPRVHLAANTSCIPAYVLLQCPAFFYGCGAQIPTLPHLDLAAEPKVRPETDFDHINVEVPQHEVGA